MKNLKKQSKIISIFNEINAILEETNQQMAKILGVEND